MNQRDTILIADDMEINRTILRSLFEKDYNLLEAANGDQALLLVAQYHNYLAAVLLDVIMPGKSGYDVLSELGHAGFLSEVPVVLITAESTSESEVLAFDLGASDIVVKPFEPHVVKRRVKNIVELNRHRQHLEDLVEEQAITLRESNEVILDALSSVIEHRSMESGQHILRIRSFTKILLEEVRRSCSEYALNDESIALISRASAMHDIGKIAIPDAVLNKPGRLTPAEFEIMKTHASKGCEVLAGLGRLNDRQFLRYAYNICRSHHERWDGRGYPDGLSGEQIPICAQVVSLADVYDALTTHRIYKEAYSPQRAFTMILNGECGVFSPKLLECFKNVEPSFAALSREYADGKTPQLREQPFLDPAAQLRQDVLPQGQMKYISLLRYLNATVMEVDFEADVYHLVYITGSDFELLRSRDSFSDTFRAFVNQVVHPDDRQMVLEMLGDYAHSLAREGLTTRARKYRIYNHPTGQYLWYTATFLCTDASVTYAGKAILIWELCEEARAPLAPAQLPTPAETAVQNLLLGVQKCRNDAWLSMVYVNEGFAAITGYTIAELAETFQNRYIDMIYPPDVPVLQARMREQLRQGKTAELEYRIVTKDGRPVWLLDKCMLTVGEDGREYLACVLMDNTRSKNAQEALRLNMERHQIIMDQTNDIIFEWDIASDRIAFSSNWEKKFGYAPVRNLVRIKIPAASHIIPEDVPVFLRLARQVLDGEPYGEAELRIANAMGRYLWCKVRATTQFDSNGAPIKAVGLIADIDNEKRQVQNLLNMAERDSLTQTFNKQTVRRRIELVLKNRQGHDGAAMFIIDVDNFKQINDRFGHMFGDALLAKIAVVLQSRFCAEDLIARVGGDEFLVLMRHVNDAALIDARAQSVIDAFQTAFSEELSSCLISCSIGISACPADGVDFQDLFQHCDKALYRAKAQGKNRFVRYQPGMLAIGFSDEGALPLAPRTRIDSDDSPETPASAFVQTTFRLLYETDDLNAAIGTILEMIGRKYNVSRVYIFESNDGGQRYDNTFEWCDEGIAPDIKRMQNIPCTLLGEDYRYNFNENGVFYCPDISALPTQLQEGLDAQNIKSLLQCAIRNGGHFVGYVGFEDCAAKRMWTQGQIDILTFLAELLSTFLFKKRAQDSADAIAHDMRMVLDKQNSWIYVIDPDTYALRYINEKTHTINATAQPGMCCYSAFFGRSEPCEQCPARGVTQSGNQTMEIYNPLYDVWSLADASHIRWRGQSAVLLSCHDITLYKKAGR